MTTHRALVVDDEPEWRELIKNELEQLGVIVDVAGSLPEAARLADATRYHLIVSDNSMPEPDQGLLLLRHVRQMCPLNKGTQFILNTGDDKPNTHATVARLDGWYRNKYSRKVSLRGLLLAALEAALR